MPRSKLDEALDLCRSGNYLVVSTAQKQFEAQGYGIIRPSTCIVSRLGPDKKDEYIKIDLSDPNVKVVLNDLRTSIHSCKEGNAVMVTFAGIQQRATVVKGTYLKLGEGPSHYFCHVKFDDGFVRILPIYDPSLATVRVTWYLMFG